MMNAHPLDLSAHRAAPRETGNEGQLERSDDGAGWVGDDDKQLSGVCVNRCERSLIGRKLPAVTLRTDLVSGDQIDDRSNIVCNRTAHDVLPARSVDPAQLVHRKAGWQMVSARLGRGEQVGRTRGD
jgi:hypothetical protein